MNIAVNGLPFNRGGGTTYLKNVLPRLAETDDQYYIFVSSNQSDIPEIDEGNIEYIEIKFPVNFILLRLLYEQLLFPLHLQKYNIDILYSPTDITTLISPCPTIIAFRNPNPYAVDRSRSLKLQLRHLVHRSLAKLSARRSSKVIFVSEYFQNLVQSSIDIDSEKCTLIYHGIDVDMFSEPIVPQDDKVKNIANKEPGYILCVSTIYPHKNYEALINGFAKLPTDLQKKHPLVIAGGTPKPSYFNSLMDLVQEHGIGDDIVFLGRIDYQAIPYLFSHATVSVLPSKLETFGHPLVESMAAETPVIASRTSAIPEIVDDAALLFDPDDPTDLMKSLEKILTSEELQEQLAKDGKHRARDFSWEKTVKDTHKLFQSVV
ncbi:hypothetical protein CHINAEXTREME_14355 [Halobiforma lacisalsi AJ5]|uniref:Group 1 glycosyl transferase n=1 Tax=Natronobacterium lacisalsi AJ5 TaxID=358396 RepID=A0A1P8LSV9_NATLA|nr:glycosyltransferase family 1 protein [Halobiforma lacisalsi]APW98883.1 hypothetical protein CHINAEXTREME_14355 [Halobiforma lacisalsi AJ5]